MFTTDYEEECTEQAPNTINFYRAPITGQGVAECTLCTFRTTYWECACELEHDCTN
jgi:hypothetical protein